MNPYCLSSCGYNIDFIVYKHFLLPVSCRRVVSPPQIEAHPRDVVDVVTGTSATFSVNVVSAAGEEVRSGGEGEEGGGGRERVGSGTREDLQIMWEVLKTNSQLPAAMNEDIGESFLYHRLSSKNQVIFCRYMITLLH